MRLVSRGGPKRVIVKEYGRGSFLAVLSPLLSFFMANRGMNGWQQRVARDMERDAQEMLSRGYRIVDSRDYEMPILGITYCKVTYELVDPPNASRSIR